MPQATATILGAGAIGMAMATVLTENKYKVIFWDIDEEVIDGINLFHKNPRSFTEVKLDKSVRAYKNIFKAVANSDMVVFAVSSKAMREVASSVADHLSRNCVIVSLAKGLEDGAFKIMPKVIREELGGNFQNQIAALSGPMLAGDLITKKPTAAMLASEKSNTYSKRAQEAFENDWFKVSQTRDVIGVSLSGVVKNALAVGNGIMSGLNFSKNTSSWVLTEGFREMARLIWKLGGTEETVYGVAGLGDMLATCSSEDSRNNKFGELIGKGKTITRALQTVGQTVEGMDAIDSLHKVALREKLNLPILSSLFEIVSQNKKASKVFDELVRNL
ncbi:NAD(P)H-dependent glycerol-3-phosphate dehydrogenase [Patescibacteria group bacterium]|nr:NAD(P)H-dependent glycerol-3-phosphate dehydrogenase [Patescibacteria group bacterium]